MSDKGRWKSSIKPYNRATFDFRRVCIWVTGFDIIKDAHERANHNFHSSYWFNRLTSFTVAQWNVNKALFPILFVAFTLLGLLGIFSLNQIAFEQSKTFWSYLFDFRDSSTTARFTGILMFTVLWTISGIGTVQSVLQRIHSPITPARRLERKREKKKKYPKRPKNYK